MTPDSTTRLLATLQRMADHKGRVPFQAAKVAAGMICGPHAADALTALLLRNQVTLRDASGAVADIDQHPTTPLYAHIND